MNIPLEDDYSPYPEKERWIRHFIDVSSSLDLF